MSVDLATRNDVTESVELALVTGDLSKLDSADRLIYYRRLCESLGLNHLTQPFAYLNLNGKLTLYATRTATDQLRRLNNVSIAITGRDRVDDVYIVTARATTPDGRSDESTGVVTLGALKGDALANALMKCETKAKRRVTLSLCGLGWMDETEVETVPGAVRVDQVEQPALTDKRARMVRRFKELLSTAIERNIDLPEMPPADRMSEQELVSAGTELSALIAADDAGRR